MTGQRKKKKETTSETRLRFAPAGTGVLKAIPCEADPTIRQAADALPGHLNVDVDDKGGWKTGDVLA